MSTIKHICRVCESDFAQPWLLERAKELCEPIPVSLHRKLWEFAVITTAWFDMSEPRNHAIGFGCGNEPLPAWFASYGCKTLATDYSTDDPKWAATGQNSSSVEGFPRRDICSQAQFDEYISFRNVDMRNVPDDLQRGEYDFCWSAGSMEHLGSHEHGLQFVCDSMSCLRDGGVAVHTTELLATLDGPTLTHPDIVAYRQRDICDLQRRLTKQGDLLLPVDFSQGDGEHDSHVDTAPYERSCCHLSVDCMGYVLTSIALVIVKGGVK